MTQEILNVWNEIRVTDEGISISLFSESRDGGAVLEDETWFTFDEMSEMTPTGPMSLRLSDEARESLDRSREFGSEDSQQSAESGSRKSAESGSRKSVEIPPVGNFVRDANPPSWSDGERLKVVGISDKSANEYQIEGHQTVYMANPSCDPDEPVAEAVYESDIGPFGNYNSDDVYAYPASRLKA